MKVVFAVSVLTAAVALMPTMDARSWPSNDLPKWKKLDFILTGEDATRWYDELLKTRPRFAAAQARSQARLAARGYRSTREVIVYRLERRSPLQVVSANAKSPTSLLTWRGLIDFFAPALSAQTQESAEGYAVFTAWDDGNHGTWEGNMYFIDEVEPIDTSIDGQLDITQEQPPPVVWASGDMAGPDGGPFPIRNDQLRSILRFQKAAAGDNRSLGQNRCRCGMPELAECFVKHGWDDSWPVCAGVAFGCLFTGPGWFKCTAGGCGGAFVGATILVGRAYWRECVRAPIPNPAGVAHHGNSSSAAVCGGLRLRSLADATAS